MIHLAQQSQLTHQLTPLFLRPKRVRLLYEYFSRFVGARVVAEGEFIAFHLDYDCAVALVSH